MKIAVHGKEFTRQSAPFIHRIFEVLTHHGADLYVSSRFSGLLKQSIFKDFRWNTYHPDDSLASLDLLISIGGDGTLLESVTHVGSTEIPVLGINTGRLGFLATISRDETEDALGQVMKRAFRLDQRRVLRLDTDPPVFGDLNFALNDCTVVKKDSSAMITIQAFVDGEFLNAYWADGLIVSTPTGSTGYSLSCGGPLISPRSGNFVLTPVSPHNLTVRPIIVADTSEITLQVESRSRKFLLTLDSRVATVDNKVKVTVRKANFHVNLVQLEGQHYFKTLRQKLMWGIDIRN